MSRQLPEHPNLEHLKHQAKDLLPDLQRRQPDAKPTFLAEGIRRTVGCLRRISSCGAPEALSTSRISSVRPSRAEASRAASASSRCSSPR